jgi:hypothetical protein
MSTVTVDTTADVDLTAATAKTILMYICAANTPARIVEFSVSFDGVVAGAEPCTVELVFSTQAGAGTTTSQTPLATSGPIRAVQGTGARNYTVEPTVLSVRKRWLVHPQAGIVMQFPLGREPQQNTSAGGIGIRVTSPGGVENCQGYIEIDEGA